MNYVIGTRGSKLAMAQAESVCDILRQAYPEHTFDVLVIRTKGDAVLDKPIHQIGDKGVFVKEIEEAILAGRVQIGVHSMKDMPAEPAEGLRFSKAWKREDPRDVLILREKKSLEELREGAVIGTGSMRRKSQLRKLRPDIKCVDIRGNVDTRIRKMHEQKLDGIVLAAAGLHRLGREGEITQYLEYEQMIPAPAQGTLALEIRADDEKTGQMLDALSDQQTDFTAEAEREFLRRIGGNCRVPVGAVCEREDGETCRLRAMFSDEDGMRIIFADVCGNDPRLLAKEAVRQIQEQFGRVYLVGAGPGDPGLITVKGLQAVREADCIIYDRLIPEELLGEAGENCELIYAGKKSHCHTMEQEEINRLLVQKGLEYEKVVRLKGGDVYVFGRGGEEALALREYGIPFEVIPGVSSATAGPAYAGIPVTHRAAAAGFHVVTAHSRKDELAEIDFEAMAEGNETCVFLMGLKKAGEIADRLLAAGMRADMPAAVISKAATAQQRTVTAKLSELRQAVCQADLPSPALIVVGETVDLRESLNFFERKPLFGRRYLVTKVGKEVSGLTGLLREMGAFVCEVQTGEIEKRRVEFLREEFDAADWLLFTSKNGVQSFFENLAESDLDVRVLSNCKIASIGKKTSKILRHYGIRADLEPREADSDSLIEALKGKIGREETLWYLGAENADSHLRDEMQGFCHIRETAVYCNRAAEFFLPDGLLDYDGVFFTCASSVRRLFHKADTAVVKYWEGEKKFYCIGPKTAEALKEAGVHQYTQAPQASYEDLAGCILGSQDW